MIRINPTKMLVGGNQQAARNFLGPARSQLEILKNQMSFQNLSQGIRRVWLNEDVYVECRKIFNYQECLVWVRPVSVLEELKEQTVRYFLVVFATGAGSEAVVWDMVSDTVFMGLNSETEVNYTLAEIENKFIKEGMQPWVEATCPATDSHVWDSSHPSHTHDAPLMLPDYYIGYFSNIGWYDLEPWIHSFVYPVSRSDWYMNFWPGETAWTLEYVDESPLPYPDKNVLSENAPKEADKEKASYINTFMGQIGEWMFPEGPYILEEDYTDIDPSLIEGSESDKHPLVLDFMRLTGVDWPTDENVEMLRYYQFWHPFFSYTLRDEQGYLDVLKSEGRGIQLTDTWEDGEWTWDEVEEAPVLEKYALTWFNSGIAAITETAESVILEDPQVLLFEYVSVCHKFVDTYETGMCDKALSDFDEYFRIYEHGKIPLSGMVKQILDLTNVERVAQGTHELVFNSVLSESAQRHAEDQATLVAASGTEGITDGHTGTDGTLPAERAFDAGYFTWIEDDVENVKNETTVWAWKVSENVGWTWDSSPAERIIQLWKASTSGHWENMIDEDLVELGIGIAGLPNGGYLFVQNFGKVDHRYPGFSPFNPDELKNYVDTNFLFDPVHEDTRQPRMYLIGSVELKDDEFERLTGRTQE